jgi:hypothetical protein
MQIQFLFYKTMKCLMASCLLLMLLSNPALSAEKDICAVCASFSLPRSLTLCGEKIPVEEAHVWEMLDREFTLSVWRRSQVFLWLKRAGRYFPYIQEKLAEAHMPDDLKYLAVAESGLLTYVRSRKGAVGLWQFMPATARRHGLRVDSKMDERRDVERSTEAAIRYLRNLKGMFGKWVPALAAYNCGEELLEKKMEVQRVRDYFRLDLPRETERFIFRIGAIKILMENPERYGYTLRPGDIYKPVSYETVSVQIDTPIHITDVAEALDSDFKSIKELNPHILGLHLPKGDITLHVPSGLGSESARMLRHLSRIAHRGESAGPCCYALVKPGDTLYRIAKRTGVSVPELRRFNSMNGSLIKVGQKLRLIP